MRRVAAAILLTLLAASAARAVDPAELSLVKTGDQIMTWSKTPTAAQLDRAFPAHATSPGHVVLRCGVTDQGALSRCAVVSEAPLDQGFAAAALGLTKDFAAWTGGFTRKQVEDASVDLPFDLHPPGQAGLAAQAVEPVWLQLPQPEEIARRFPQAAAKAGLKSGLGVVHCTATRLGELVNCTVAREDPAGAGFGSAALMVAKEMSMNPWTREGRPVDGAQLLIPIRLKLAADTPPPMGDIKIADFGDWTRKAGTAGPYTPDRACRVGVRKALAVIDCKVGLDGTLSACSVVADDPPDYGFGEAAIKMAQRHVMTTSPVLVDGKPVADHVVRLSLPFNIPPGNCFIPHG